jgi:hypothetical protein
MNNPFLQAKSISFSDDTFEQIERCCFFAFCGAVNNTAGLSINVKLNLFHDPKKTKMTLGCQLTLDQLVFEYNNDILKALTNLAVQYKIGFMFSDLCPAPGPTAKNRFRCLQRRVALQAPLYAMRKQLTQRSLKKDLDGAIVKYQAEKVKERVEKEKEDHIEYQKKVKEGQRELRKSLEKLDKDIAELNCDVNIQINRIYLGLVNDRDDRITPGQTLLEAGLSD